MVRLARSIDEGRGESEGTTPPPLSAEGLVGGVLSLLHTRLAQDEHEPLLELASQLTSMIVLPYLGQAAAKRELERPEPPAVAGPSSDRSLPDPFKEAGMRLTYRTVRVLLTIAELSDQGISPSNRQVGKKAGIADQGQMSKLLGRLRRIGLIDNTGLGPGLGAPNSWSLTAKGARLADSIRTHTGTSAHEGTQRNGRSRDR